MGEDLMLEKSMCDGVMEDPTTSSSSSSDVIMIMNYFWAGLTFVSTLTPPTGMLWFGMVRHLFLEQRGTDVYFVIHHHKRVPLCIALFIAGWMVGLFLLYILFNYTWLGKDYSRSNLSHPSFSSSSATSSSSSSASLSSSSLLLLPVSNKPIRDLEVIHG